MRGLDKRNYQRSSDFVCDAKVSKDGETWTETEVYDLSSGGLKLQTDEQYEIGEKLLFDLTIKGLLSEFDVIVQGVIRRQEVTKGVGTYGISFEGLDQDLKIRIDESVNHFRPKDMWD